MGRNFSDSKNCSPCGGQPSDFTFWPCVCALNVITKNVSYPVMGKTCPCVCAGLGKSRGEHTGACELGLGEWFRAFVFSL